MNLLLGACLGSIGSTRRVKACDTVLFFARVFASRTVAMCVGTR
jgi:hypothetical protein